MASIPGAVFMASKIHDEKSRFRKRSASDAMEKKPFDEAIAKDLAFRERSVSMTTPPWSNASTPIGGPVSGMSPAISGDSIRNLVGGFIGGINVLKPKNFIDSSLESVNEDLPIMRSHPNAGSLTDLAHVK